MKDLVFDLFAPRTYGQTRSLTYSPRSAVTIRQWQKAVREYDETFRLFMKQEFFTSTGDELTMDQYLTAIKMNDRAMAMLAKMEETLYIVREYYRGADNLYNEMMKQDSLVPFFREFQETSYYFTNNFEGFMRYFINSLQDHAAGLQKRLSIIFITSVIIIAITYILLTLLLLRDMDRKISALQSRFRKVSRGDFTLVNQGHHYHDEFGELSITFDNLVVELKDNIDSILRLSRDIGSSISLKPDLEALYNLVVQAVVEDTSSRTAFVVRSRGRDKPVMAAAAGEIPGERLSGQILDRIEKLQVKPGIFLHLLCTVEEGFERNISLLVLPLIVKEGIFGMLIALKFPEDNDFSDLGKTRLATFAEFASLSIDNFLAYKELIERREAQYQALHSQVQPHFINNVLNGFMGLNRKGDRDGLDSAIISLREMLRYVQNRRPWTSLAEEIDFLEQYCNLQKIRFTDRLDYRFEIDEKCRYLQIPRLLLQPLVENAIIHGIEPLERPGTLEIRCRAVRRLGEIHADIEISDNGAGFDTATLEERQQIGLLNVRERLTAAFPEHRFEIESTINAGTRVMLFL
jgi:sensor histidine kinase YesM